MEKNKEHNHKWFPYGVTRTDNPETDRGYDVWIVFECLEDKCDEITTQFVFRGE